MFTGIIEEVGRIRAIERQAVSARLTVAASKVLSDVHLGDSIAVNGVCPTVTSFGRDYFCADVMHETLNRSSLGALGVKSPVNLERAMLAGGRFGGQSAADLPDSGREKSDPGDCRYEASDTAFIDRGTDRAGDTDLDCDGGIGCRKKESI